MSSPTTSTPVAPSASTETDGTTSRRIAIRSYLTNLQKLTVISPNANSSQSINCGNGQTLRLSPWEWGAVIQAYKGGESGGNYTALVAESVALQIKTIDDLQKLAAAAPAPPEVAAVAEADSVESQPEAAAEPKQAPVETQFAQPLIQDLAYSLALGNDLGEAMDGLRKAGQVDKANQVAQFASRLRDFFQKVTDALGPDAASAAEAAIGQFARPEGALIPAAPAPTTRTANVRAVRPAAPTSRWGRMSPAARDRAKLAAIGSIVAAAVAITMFTLPAMNQKALPVLSIEEFKRYEEVADVVARPPNLFVKIDAAKWQAMDRDAQLALMTRIAQQIEPSGYAAAHFNAKSGTPLGRWMKSQGAMLFEK